MECNLILIDEVTNHYFLIYTTRKLGFSDGHFPSEKSQNSVANNFLTDFATLHKSVVIMGVGKN